MGREENIKPFPRAFSPLHYPDALPRGDALLDTTRFARCVGLACPGLIYLGPLARRVWTLSLCRTVLARFLRSKRSIWQMIDKLNYLSIAINSSSKSRIVASKPFIDHDLAPESVPFHGIVARGTMFKPR